MTTSPSVSADADAAAVEPGQPGPSAPSSEPPAPPKKGWFRRFLREWVLPLAIAAAVLLPIRSAIADWNDVPTGSMRPTIIEGDRIWVNKLAYGLRVPFSRSWIARWDAPARGEIVTFASPTDGRRLVKRIIGAPGDVISMSDNRLCVNGEPIGYELVESGVEALLPDGQSVRMVIADERLPGSTHAIALTPGLASRDDVPEFAVPEGHYFLMGDNRDQSLDSRMFGLVPEGDIYGRSSYVALSLDRDNWYKPRFGRWLSRLR